jgi:preprotein translocase SecE subunit
MANITRIKSGSGKPADDEPREEPKRIVAEVKTTPTKKATKPVEPKKPQSKKPKVERHGFPKFIYIVSSPIRWLFWPFKQFGLYIVNSWREIVQVQWPDRKLTWKLTFAVIFYTILIALVITGLDALFTFVFNSILG